MIQLNITIREKLSYICALVIVWHEHGETLTWDPSHQLLTLPVSIRLFRGSRRREWHSKCYGNNVTANNFLPLTILSQRWQDCFRSAESTEGFRERRSWASTGPMFRSRGLNLWHLASGGGGSVRPKCSSPSFREGGAGEHCLQAPAASSSQDVTVTRQHFIDPGSFVLQRKVVLLVFLPKRNVTPLSREDLVAALVYYKGSTSSSNFCKALLGNICGSKGRTPQTRYRIKGPVWKMWNVKMLKYSETYLSSLTVPHCVADTFWTFWTQWETALMVFKFPLLPVSTQFDCVLHFCPCWLEHVWPECFWFLLTTLFVVLFLVLQQCSIPIWDQ